MYSILWGKILRGNELEKKVRPIRSVIAPKAPKYIRKLTFYPLIRGKNYIKKILDREPDITPHGLSRIWVSTGRGDTGDT